MAGTKLRLLLGREMAERAIVDFHPDEHGDWVADLECGHGQHVRHRPPWELRPWVVTEEGRRAHLGQMLRCLRCDEEQELSFRFGVSQNSA